MSRLDSFIRRMQAQRACLDRAINLMRDLPGDVLEIGLGNGRTYDHLREHLPNRRIIAFDRHLAAHPKSVPPEGTFVRGDVISTLPLYRSPLSTPVALVHIDIGSGDEVANGRLAEELAPVVADLAQPGMVVVSDLDLEEPRLQPLALPQSVKSGRYRMYTALVSATS